MPFSQTNFYKNYKILNNSQTNPLKKFLSSFKKFHFSFSFNAINEVIKI